MSKFIERLKELRADRGLTQQQLADATGLSNATIANYELGKRTPSAHCLVILAKYFGVTTDYLLGLSDHPICYCT